MICTSDLTVKGLCIPATFYSPKLISLHNARNWGEYKCLILWYSCRNAFKSVKLGCWHKHFSLCGAGRMDVMNDIIQCHNFLCIIIVLFLTSGTFTHYVLELDTSETIVFKNSYQSCGTFLLILQKIIYKELLWLSYSTV